MGWMCDYCICHIDGQLYMLSRPITFIPYSTVESVFWKKAMGKVMCFSMNLQSASTAAFLLALILKNTSCPMDISYLWGLKYHFWFIDFSLWSVVDHSSHCRCTFTTYTLTPLYWKITLFYKKMNLLISTYFYLIFNRQCFPPWR